MRHCLDCGMELTPERKFCSNCGQRTATERLSLHDIGHDFVHALVHADRSAYALLKSLCLRPGIVAREYVQGKRRRHFGPFATLVVLIGISTLISELVGFESITSSAQLNDLQRFLNRHVNLIVFAEVPILSLLCLGLFRADRYTFAENTVLATYAFCFRVVFFVIIVLPCWYVFQPNPALIGYGVEAIWSAYFGWAASQFYSGNRVVTWIKGALAAVLMWQVSSLLITALSVGYVRLKGG